MGWFLNSFEDFRLVRVFQKWPVDWIWPMFWKTEDIQKRWFSPVKLMKWLTICELVDDVGISVLSINDDPFYFFWLTRKWHFGRFDIHVTPETPPVTFLEYVSHTEKLYDVDDNDVEMFEVHTKLIRRYGSRIWKMIVNTNRIQSRLMHILVESPIYIHVFLHVKPVKYILFPHTCTVNSLFVLVVFMTRIRENRLRIYRLGRVGGKFRENPQVLTSSCNSFIDQKTY